MKLSPRGLALIQEFEGYHRKLPDGGCIAYRCPAGVWTLGWGCTEGIKPGMIWTRAQADAALMHELAHFEDAVTKLVTVDINQNEYDALVSFAYNCGESALARSSILKCLNAGDREAAARGFALWNRGGGRVLPGLVRRRAAEAALFRQWVVPPADPEMPQQVDPPAEKPVASRKWRAQEWLKRLFGIGTAGGVGAKASSDAGFDPGGMIDMAARIIKLYGVELAILAGAVGTILFLLLQHWQRQDYEAGRFIPSGDAP